MARLPRLVIPGQLHSLIACGHNDQAVFRDEDDFHAFLQWLRDAALQADVALHAYALLPNRVQFLATPAQEVGLSKMMQAVGRQYVPYFNLKYDRSGSLWEGRFRATVIEAEVYFTACAHLIEYQPVWTGLVAEANAYRWSSYAHHIGSHKDALITDHPGYWALGNTPFDREAAYKRLCESPPTAQLAAMIEQCTQKAWVLGSDNFTRELEKQTTRRLKPARRGRPAKSPLADASAPEKVRTGIGATRHAVKGQAKIK